MKFLSLFAVPLLIISNGFSQELDLPLQNSKRENFDPLGIKEGERDLSHLPKQILIQIEFIEMEQVVLTDLLYGDGLLKSGGELRADVQKLIKEDKAKMYASSVITSRPGETSRVESAANVVHPTDYDPPQIPSNGQTLEDTKIAPPTATAFEETKAGIVVDVTPDIGVGEDRNYISMEIEPSIVSHEGNFNWATWKHKNGESNISMAKFYDLNVQTGITLQSGKYSFLCTLYPQDEKGQTDYDRQLLVFVRGVIKHIGR